MTSDSGNTAFESEKRAQAWKEINERSGGVTSVDEFKQKYLKVDCRATQEDERNKKLWSGEYGSCKKGYRCAEDAVSALVFDASWYTNYDVELVADIVKASSYMGGVDYDPNQLPGWIIDAYIRQDGRTFGTSKSDDDSSHSDSDESEQKTDTTQNTSRQRRKPDSSGLDGASIPRNLSKL